MRVALSRLLHRLGMHAAARWVQPTPRVEPLRQVPGVPDLPRSAPSPDEVYQAWMGPTVIPSTSWVNQRGYGERSDPSRGQVRPE